MRGEAQRSLRHRYSEEKRERVENFFQIAERFDSHVDSISEDSRFETDVRKVPRDF